MGNRIDILFRPDQVDKRAGAGFGFRAVWANRPGEPLDRLPWRPAHVVADLSTVPEIAAA